MVFKVPSNQIWSQVMSFGKNTQKVVNQSSQFKKAALNSSQMPTLHGSSCHGSCWCRTCKTIQWYRNKAKWALLHKPCGNMGHLVAVCWIPAHPCSAWEVLALVAAEYHSFHVGRMLRAPRQLLADWWPGHSFRMRRTTSNLLFLLLDY